MVTRGGAWRAWAAGLKRELRALHLALRDPRTPWYARLAAGLVVAYAVSPLDLIPDPIPLVGYLDDLVLLPLGIWAVRRMIPADVLEECRRRAAAERPRPGSPLRWLGLGIVVALWLLVLAGLVAMAWRWW